MRRFLIRLKHYLFPTVGNRYRPGMFVRDSVVALVAVVLFGQVAWFGVTTFVSKNPGFLGAILPGVLTALTNSDRATNGVPALATNELLTKAAQAKADDMAAKGYFSHVTPDGKEPWYWLDQAGYRYTYAGENLAVDFTDSTDVEDAWMKSPTHRANIVKAQYTEVGIAVANGTYKGKDAVFVVQFFGKPASPGARPASTAAASPLVPATELATVRVPASTASAAVASAPTTVLGESVAPAPVSHAGGILQNVRSLLSRAADIIRTAVTSPTHTMAYALGGLAAVVGILLVIGIFVRFDIQYAEVIGGGAMILAVIGCSLFFLESRMDHVALPPDSQSASVYVGFQGAD